LIDKEKGIDNGRKGKNHCFYGFFSGSYRGVIGEFIGEFIGEIV